MYNYFIYPILFFLALCVFVLVLSGLLAFGGGVLFFFAIFLSFFAFYLCRRRLAGKMRKEFDSLEEQINILDDSIANKAKVLQYLPSKQDKAVFLFELSQKLIELDNPDEIFDFLISVTEKLLPGFTFVSLFNFDKKKNALELIRSIKRKDAIIEEKQGSELERWVLRQNSSLLVENINDDFRFDPNRIDAFGRRQSLSFLASPLSVGESFLGILRIENDQPGSFSYDDLRFLTNICDLAAVALERAYLIRRVQELAVTDSLTNLPLRNYFSKKVKIEIERARSSNTNLGILMLDIDNFKNINDLHGHIVGDLVLKRLARMFKRLEEKPEITACRYGGEEFMVLITDTAKDSLAKAAEDIRDKVSRLVVSYRRNQVKFTVSVGAALFPQDGAVTEKILESADNLMYKAKRQGKNKVCFST